MSGHRAALPAPDLILARDTTSVLGGLRVSLRLENAPAYAVDLTGKPAPETVRREIAEAFLVRSSSFNGLRRVDSVKAVQRSASAWLRWIEQWNMGHADALVGSFSDLTPFHMRQYLAHVTATYAAHTADGYYRDICILLRSSARVTVATAREVRKRRGSPKQTYQVERYTHAEFVSIRNAARRVIESAHERVSESVREARSLGDPSCADPARAAALNAVLMTGAPSDLPGFYALDAVGSSYFGHIGRARRHLFLDGDEAFAAIVLLVCHRGLNLAPVLAAMTPHTLGMGMIQLDLDKPRRGPGARFWPEIIDDADQDFEAATLIQMIAEMTEPARVAREALGLPTNSLILRWGARHVHPLDGIPAAKERAKAGWVPVGVRIDFRRLRRSIPGRGVAKEPTHHDSATYLKYIRTDPLALAERQFEAVQGIQDAMDRARKEIHIRLRDENELDPDHDALIVNCNDPAHHPLTGAACTTAFFSFLDCLDCSNAATVSRLLPRQLAAVDVLERLRDALGKTWERRFARRYYMLKAMIERHTEAEREEAAHRKEEHIPMILAALRHEVPR